MYMYTSVMDLQNTINIQIDLIGTHIFKSNI